MPFPLAGITIPASHLLHFSASLRVRIAMVASSSAGGCGAYTTIKERLTIEKDIKKSKFIAIAGPVSDEQSAFSFLSQVSDPRATHNWWAYKVGDRYRSNDDGEPSGTAGKPIQSAGYVFRDRQSDGCCHQFLRYFGGIKLGTGGQVRAYGAVALECLRNAPICLVKSKVCMGVEVPFDLIGVLNHQLQSFQVDDIVQDFETGKEGFAMVSFKVNFEKIEQLEDAIKANCSRDLVFYKQ